MADDPLILSLETATLGGTVFLARGRQALASRKGDPAVSHSNSLLRDINDCFEESGLSLHDVDLFACAAGPGSFTGLRIGIATLKALAATLQKPCFGIPTLRAIAYAAGESDATVALLPAGRGELFAQLFSISKDGIVSEVDSASHLSPQKLLDKYGAHRRLKWAGNGARVQQQLLEDYAKQHNLSFSVQDSRAHSLRAQAGWTIAPAESNLAVHVAALALAEFENGKRESAQSLSAIYVRPSDAELNQPCR